MATLTQTTNATPSTPSSGSAVLYWKSDGLAYWLDDAGVERQVLYQVSNTTLMGIGKNAIINGDMEIAQRGTSFAAIANGTYSLDRWVYNKVGAAVHTVTQDTDVPTVAQAGRLFTHSIKLALTTADTAIAAGDFVLLRQAVEGYNWRALAQRIITLSFWIKSPITGIHCVALENSAADRSIVKEFTVNVVNTWEKKTLTFAASPSAGTWDYTNGTGAFLSFTLAAGSTYQGTADSYQSSRLFATANQVNGVNTGITPYFITGVQLEAGSVATEFEGRAAGTELALCQRYYEKSFPFSTAPAQGAGLTGALHFAATKAGALSNYTAATYQVTKRTNPTVTTYNPSSANGEMRDITAAADMAGTTVNTGSNDRSLVVTATGAAGTAVGNGIAVHWSASAEL